MKDTFLSIQAVAEAEIKVKGSRFVAGAYPVATAEAAEAEIARIRKKGYTATHHCTAYRVGPQGSTFRYQDDGEPSGTAGPPILRQIDGHALTNTLVVVTRYYGGTKLGTGGLIRAYGGAAAEALDNAVIIEHIIRERLRIRFAYADTSPALHTVHQYDAEIEDMQYGDDTTLVVALRLSQVESFEAAFVEALHGRGRIERMG